MSLEEELSSLSTDDLERIWQDQADRYSKEELAVVRREWASRCAAEEATGTPSRQPAAVCLFCGRENPPDRLYCEACGHPLALPSRLPPPSAHEDRDWSRWRNYGCYILSLLNPLLGVLIGLSYRHRHAHLSKWCLIHAGISVLIYLLIGLLSTL